MTLVLVGKGLVFGVLTVNYRGHLGLQVLESHGVLCTNSKAPKKEEDRKKASGSHAGVVSTPRKSTSPQNQHATGSIGNTSSNHQFLGDIFSFPGSNMESKNYLKLKRKIIFLQQKQGPICCLFFLELPESVGQGWQRWGQLSSFVSEPRNASRGVSEWLDMKNFVR